MSKLRSVNTRFWEDSWVEELTPSDKLLFLYLITNSSTNLAGIYEITLKRICFETGLDKQTVRKGLERFERVRKAYFVCESYMFLPNWLKNQKLNSNMKVGVVKIIQELPKEVKIKILGNGYQTLSNGYQTLSNALLKYEVEVEVEVEVEEECDLPQGLKPPKFNFKKSLEEKGVKEPHLSDWLEVRKKKKSTNSETALKGVIKQAEKAGITLDQAVLTAAENSWSGFNAEWYSNKNQNKPKQSRSEYINQELNKHFGQNEPEPEQTHDIDYTEVNIDDFKGL